MLIGFTYDLRSEYLAQGYSDEETAEFDQPVTIEGIAGALSALGHSVVRIGHVRSLAARLVAGERWDLVFNICEGLHGAAREAQAPALLDAFNIPYTFSDPLVTALCLHKGLTKTVLREAGILTPRSVLVSKLADVSNVQLSPPLFAKPVAEGTGKGITAASRIASLESLADVCARLLQQFRQPVLVEEFLPGREFTTGLLGTGEKAAVLGTLEVHLLASAEPGVYSYVNKEQCEERVRYELVRPDQDPVVAEAERLALRAWRALNCRDAGRIDIRCDAAGRPQFLEVNPLAGLNPEHSDLPMLAARVGLSFQELIARIVDSAAQRIDRSGVGG
jgi:D-alanine-D-alanine ligase